MFISIQQFSFASVRGEENKYNIILKNTNETNKLRRNILGEGKAGSSRKTKRNIGYSLSLSHSIGVCVSVRKREKITIIKIKPKMQKTMNTIIIYHTK